jgi:hypothetical protein
MTFVEYLRFLSRQTPPPGGARRKIPEGEEPFEL